MAGPDPDVSRSRRNTPQKLQGRTILPAGRVGNPPKPRTELPVSDAGEQFWRDLWSTPQAVMWGKAELHTATRLLLAWEELQVDGYSGKLSSEMRQLEHALGLTAKAMKELGWEVEQPDDAKQKTDASDEEMIPEEYAGLRVVTDAS